MWAPAWAHGRFNPCFRGTCSWCSLRLIFLTTAPSFSEGFNPCFRGTCSWWTLASPICCRGMSFNPCFRGTCSWWEVNPGPQRARWTFQSLFSWNLLLMGDFVVWYKYLDEFQSLFSWNLLLMGTRWAGRQNTNEVSILVFVELALDVQSFLGWPHQQTVSILVFVELALEGFEKLINRNVYILLTS